MKTIRIVNCWIPRHGIFHAPTAQLVPVYLVESGGNYFIQSPWAMIDAPRGLDTTDAQLLAIVRPHYGTEDEALADAMACAPFWHRPDNQVIIGRLHDCLRWDGEICGPPNLADAIGESRERLYAICRGEIKATRKQASAAREYRGQKV